MTLEKSTSKVTEGDAADPTVKISTKTVRGKNPNPSSRDKNGNLGGDPFAIEVPGKIHVGKPTVPNQQLLIFVGIIAFLFHAAFKMGAMIQIDPNKKYQRLTVSKPKQNRERLESIRRTIRDAIETAVLENPSIFGKWTAGINNGEDDDDPCGIYTGESSIPETGWGWFAGKDYTAGEAIRREYSRSLSVPPVFGSRSASETTSNHSLGIPPLRFVLKPHSILSNVRWDDENDSSSSLSQDHSLSDWTVSVLKATRDIREGEEFFLSWEDYPFATSKVSHNDVNAIHKSFDDIYTKFLPTFEHFERADELIREARIQYFGAINYTKLEIDKTKEKESVVPASSNARWNRARHKTKRKSSSSQQPYKSESADDIENGLKLWQRAVETHDPLVAKLLPTKVRTLAMYHRRAEEDESLVSSSSSLGSLRNQTVWSLANAATCVSVFEWQLVSPPSATRETATEDILETNESLERAPNLQKQASCSAQSSYHQVVARKRGFVKGEIVGVVPLLLLPRSHGQEPSAVTMSGNGDCLTIKSSSSVLDLVSCPVGGIYERSNDLSSANVEYRWSDRTIDQIPLEVKTLVKSSSSQSLSVEEEQNLKEIFLETFQKNPLSMSWDIVALRDMHQNETMVLYQLDDVMEFVSSIEATELET